MDIETATAVAHLVAHCTRNAKVVGLVPTGGKLFFRQISVPIIVATFQSKLHNFPELSLASLSAGFIWLRLKIRPLGHSHPFALVNWKLLLNVNQYSGTKLSFFGIAQFMVPWCPLCLKNILHDLMFLVR